jgi:hypothetical protein
VGGLQRELDIVALLPTGRPRLSCALRIRYWTVFLCSTSRSAVVL